MEVNVEAIIDDFAHECAQLGWAKAASVVDRYRESEDWSDDMVAALDGIAVALRRAGVVEARS